MDCNFAQSKGNKEMTRITGKIYVDNYKEGVKIIRENQKKLGNVNARDMNEDQFKKVIFHIPERTYTIDERNEIIEI